MTDGPNKFEQVRVEKLRQIEAMGLDPWGSRFPDVEPIASLRARVPDTNDHAQMPRARTAGRVLALRDSGKVIFIDLNDKSGRIQVMIGQKQVGEANWQLAKHFDLWDLLGVEGQLGRTRTGEPTIFADNLTILTKTLAHPPEKHSGLQDVELRLRRRYVDMVQNPEVLHRFETRARIIRVMRSFLDKRGFTEVETPTMQAIAGGAAARPFITHHNALDIQLYLRIAPELYLKRLLVGGMERVFEIARVFRNEGVDATHNPEFTMMELYEAYGDYNTMMELLESMVVEAVDALGVGRVLPYGEHSINFSPPWRRATYDELLREHVGVGLDDGEGLARVAKERGLETAQKDPDVIASELFEKFVEDELMGPVFVCDYPAALCPLTKRKANNPRLAERFEVFIRGMELANAYTELNDPMLQEDLFTRQLAGLPAEESMAKMDTDFVLALKHGMPPAGGLGVGIDRLIMLLSNSQTIRDVVIFPLLRPERPIGAIAAEENEETTPNPQP